MHADPSKLMKVHQAVARALADNGVDTIFGVMGDANMFAMHSFVHDCGGIFVSASHEVGAALMALGYATLSGKAGVCSVTHGPGLTNTVTALVEGVKGSVPMVIVCGDTALLDRENNQNVAQRDIVIATGAGFEQLRSPQTASQDVAMALRRAMTERRPIALNMPSELDWSPVDYQPVIVRLPVDRAVVLASEDLDNAIGMMAAARRPVILAGRGAACAAAKCAILKLARRIEAPLTTTLKAKDLFDGEDYNLGICGTVSTQAAVETIMESDCLISFGASLNYRTTSKGAFLRGKRVIQVNLEQSEIGKNVQPDVGLVGDPAAVADLMTHWLDEAEIPPSSWYSDELKERIASARPDIDQQDDYDNGTVNYLSTLLRIGAFLPQDRILVTDGGRFMLRTWPLLRASPGRSFIAPVNFGSIGLGLSHAIGAAYAGRGRPVVLVTGDGGFMNGGLAEFNTAVRGKLDLIVIICNDNAYGAEVVKFNDRYPGDKMDPGMITFDWPDFAPVAIALGGNGVTIRSANDLVSAEQAISQRNGPLLIDIKVDPYRMAMSLG